MDAQKKGQSEKRRRYESVTGYERRSALRGEEE